MTSTEHPTTFDPRAVFGRAFATAGEVLAGLRPVDMGRPTPCTEYDVRTLAGHLLAVARRVRNVGRGESPFSVPEVVEGVTDDGWTVAWDEVGSAIVSAWADDATLARTVTLPWATMPGSATLLMWTNELTVHSWDLATATGQSPEWDTDALEAAFASIRMGLPAEGRVESFEAARQNMPEGMEDFTPPFAAAVEVPDDAPLIDRLVAWNGRDPH
jgi:uncharacterized protein (TIGR03086 family)